jgi:hypothetical protein
MMALDLLERRDESFLAGFLKTLKTETKFKSYYFETPPMTEVKVQLSIYYVDRYSN